MQHVTIMSLRSGWVRTSRSVFHDKYIWCQSWHAWAITVSSHAEIKPIVATVHVHTNFEPISVLRTFRLHRSIQVSSSCSNSPLQWHCLNIDQTMVRHDKEQILPPAMQASQNDGALRCSRIHAIATLVCAHSSHSDQPSDRAHLLRGLLIEGSLIVIKV